MEPFGQWPPDREVSSYRTPPEGSRIGYRAELDVPRYWTDAGFKIIKKIIEIARALEKSPSQVSPAWLLHDWRVTAVVIGARTTEQLANNVAVGDWDLPDESCKDLAQVVKFDHGYPMVWINTTYSHTFEKEESAPRPATLPPGYESGQ